MEKLKLLIEQHRRWQDLELFVSRIEATLETDFSQSLENAKALLESISKEICDHYQIALNNTESFNGLLRKAFTSLGYGSTGLVNQISTSLANIGQQMGNLRNEIGTTSHGRTLEEIRNRNSRVNEFTKEFLIDTTVLVACFLIQNFEKDSPIITDSSEQRLDYDKCEDFNQEWDNIYGGFPMGSYSFLASEILYWTDYNDYEKEYKLFQAEPPEL